jgi:hypothetical protein
MSIRTITVNGRGYNTTQAEISVKVNDVVIYIRIFLIQKVSGSNSISTRNSNNI